MLYGPPGNGKTFLAEAILKSTQRSLLSFIIPSLFNEVNEHFIKNIFLMTRKQSSIVFIDEIDSLCRIDKNIES